MTVEVFDPAPIYVIAGTGPYAVPHPYAAGAIRVSVVTEREVIQLDQDDFTITPEASFVFGDVFLSAPAAALHAGQSLLIERETQDEQGWAGLLGERERGLERQLDQLTMANQELRRRLATSLRSIAAINPVIPANGRALIWENDQLVPGPSAAAIAEAEGILTGVTSPPYAPFETRAQAMATVVPDRIGYIVVGGLPFAATTDADHAALTTAGGRMWTPAGVWTPAHFDSFEDFIAKSGVAAVAELDKAEVVRSAQVTGFGPGQKLVGVGADKSIIRRNFSRGSLINVDGQAGMRIEGLTLDMGTGAEGGHAIRNLGDYSIVRDLIVRGYFHPTGGAGGTGVLAAGTAEIPVRGVRISDLILSGAINPNALETFGWIFSDVWHGFAHHIYSENALGDVTAMAHELKNDARWNNLHALTAFNSIYGLGFGQTTVGINGAKYNVALGLLAHACDRGFSASEGARNLIIGLIHDPTDGPGRIAPAAVELRNSSERNIAESIMSLGGSNSRGALIDSSFGNFVSLYMMGNGAAKVADITGATAIRNVIEVRHPGGSNSVRDRVTDTSGASRRSGNANVVYCPATGERIGSISGTFHDVLSASGDLGIQWNPAHYWRYEADTRTIHALGTDGSLGNIAGITHATPDTEERGSIWHQLGATPAGDFWAVRGWGKGTTFAFLADAFQPATTYSEALDLGSSQGRWRAVYTTLVDYGGGVRDMVGNGAPEGVVPGGKSSTYRRRDGAAGSCFYVKESGTGTTGWIAK
ncbi:hypothetical protein PARHAE_01077 [Paracoccus haematequi]|uniref:Uncharacterized protein n=1 Tax=Paracoccus haematequi TaxID=2491866 RepID=A0A3S4CHL5_9RHOB|nr:hypothetical protein [Paracoccus haematequi]VDS07897.1 hypothetical protein PARHAE_01077 [Paracoccus haematequi]